MVSRIINRPNVLVNISIALEASFTTKIPIAIRQLNTAPVGTSVPTSILRPRPAPATFPILKAKPPKRIKMANR
ncbi:hypothetical protein D9M68_645180 [compost metagenome]